MPSSGSPRPLHAATILVAADWAPIRAFDPIIRRDPAAVYGDLLPLLRQADLRIVNCECSLTRGTTPVWKSGAVFKGEPEHVNGLSVVPFDVACLANNHVLDYGVAGLGESLRILHRRGIRTVGAGLTEPEAYAPLTLRIRGLRLHIVNFSEGEDLTAARNGPGVFGWDIPRVIEQVRHCRKQGGVVLAIGHCGLEYVPYPPPYVVAAFRAVAEAGAHCVIGHHPHVPQGMEWYQGRPIVYSLGNFAFYQPTGLYYRKLGFCVTLQIDRRGLSKIELHPYRITDAGLSALDAGQDREFRRTIARISKPFATRKGHERAWAAYLDAYGLEGFTAEVKGILDRLPAEPQKAAAMFRNRVTTMQHAELWKDVLTRIMAGRVGRAATAQTRRVVREWLTRTIEPT